MAAVCLGLPDGGGAVAAAKQPENSRRRTLTPTGPERVAVTLYGLVLLAVRLLLAGLFAYASRQGLLIDTLASSDSEEVAAVRRKFAPTILAYAATVAAGLLLPVAAVAVYFGIAIFAVTPFRQVARLLRRQRDPGS
jgi:hypothetical protein